VTGKDAHVKLRLSAFVFIAALAVPTFAKAAPAALTQRPLAVQALPLPVPQYLAEIIRDASAKYGVDPNLIASVAFKESRYNARAVSRIGAEGIMQLKPKTARHLGVADSFDARQNVFGGVKYLRTLLDQFGGNVDYALAAYNAGPTLVAKVGPNATAEATEYVATIKRYYATALAAL
jgi:soluble lytic murein transglycosylase-like protein